MHNDNLDNLRESGPAAAAGSATTSGDSVTSHHMLEQGSKIAAINRMTAGVIVHRKALAAGLPAVRRAEPTERERLRRNR